jgi:antitoxin HicB
MMEAEDCLSEAIQARINDEEDLPEASRAKKGQFMVPVEVTTALKAAVHQRMKLKGIRQIELARTMKIDGKEVRRLLDPKHRTKVGALQNAMHAMGAKVFVTVEEEDEIALTA